MGQEQEDFSNVEILVIFVIIICLLIGSYLVVTRKIYKSHLGHFYIIKQLNGPIVKHDKDKCEFLYASWVAIKYRKDTMTMPTKNGKAEWVRISPINIPLKEAMKCQDKFYKEAVIQEKRLEETYKKTIEDMKCIGK